VGADIERGRVTVKQLSQIKLWLSSPYAVIVRVLAHSLLSSLETWLMQSLVLPSSLYDIATGYRVEGSGSIPGSVRIFSSQRPDRF
jgi:hypothetical protein